MSIELIEVTRDQLYEQVWSEPMTAVARRFSLSDVGLAKICRKMRIPVPGRGYWARKAAGQPVKQVPLGKLPAAAPVAMHTVTIRRPPIEASAPTGEPVGPVATQARFEADPANRIDVAATLTDPHPLVERTVHALRRAKTDDQGYLKPAGAQCLALRSSSRCYRRRASLDRSSYFATCTSLVGSLW